jgi:shikimate kinase
MSESEIATPGQSGQGPAIWAILVDDTSIFAVVESELTVDRVEERP